MSQRQCCLMVTVRPSKGDVELLQSIVPVSRETMELLQIHVDLLVEWQIKTNLVANSTVKEIWHRHVCDSAQNYQIKPDVDYWVDIGSGAGFPGLVVAILFRERNDFRMQLVESNTKKCAFMRKVIRETGINAQVTDNRIESVTKQPQKIQIVSARALARLNKLFVLTGDWLENGAVGLFAKGRDYLHELQECRGVWDFDLVTHKSRIEKNSVLLEISNLTKFKK